MSNQTDPTILNPDTYLNHFTPAQAKQFEVMRDLYIAVLGAVACDILSFTPQDVRIIKRFNGLISTACFVFARIFALGYLAMSVALLTGPVANCRGVTLATAVFCVLTMSTTSFLFLRRVQAVYTGNRMVYWTFAFLWTGSNGVFVLLIPGAKSRTLPGTGYCTPSKAANYVPISNFMPAVFDTLIFFAISYKIAFQYNRISSVSSWAGSWFSARTLPMLSKAILQSGQQYYLITFILNVFAGVFSFGPLVPPMQRTLMSAPSIAFSACLACRAHRVLVEAFYHQDEEVLSKISTLRFAGTSELHPTTHSQSISGAGTESA